MGLMKILFLPLQLTAKSPAASLPISYKYMAWDLDLFNNSAALLSSLRLLLPKASLEDGVNTEWGTTPACASNCAGQLDEYIRKGTRENLLLAGIP